MENLFNLYGRFIYGIISIGLGLIGLTMMIFSLWEIWISFHEKTLLIKALLDAIGLIVIGMAVFDVSKFLLEEEVFHVGGKSPERQRATLVKFFLIIAIAISLESLVFVFDSGKKDISNLIYPTFLLISSVFVIIGLGIYQKLTLKEK